ncbi:MAG TPA: sigma 54-interacting transcriptional regulator, partial [Steroidobacteraceae bacterium]|nr:sigma 54-interacting transcriptional regulator [Steroidobacteraceae bacterium]
QACGTGRRAIWELRDRQTGNRYYARLGGAGSPTPRRTPAPKHAPPGSAGALTLEQLAGADPQMQRNVRAAHRVADSDMTVLVCGPTGCGKEMLARAIHAAGARSTRPFVAVNCAAIPEALIESELFGYAPGAFTGARRQGMRGRIEQSSGGTLFLDEIGDMPLALQTRLLRVLEEREVLPLAAEGPRKVDLRVIAASHRNLRDMVAHGEFREDLFYRLNGITIDLPPLARREDLEAVIRDCLRLESYPGPAAGIEAPALRHLLGYTWPGNIRELRNALRAALLMGDGRTIRAGDLPGHIIAAPAATAGASDEPGAGSSVLAAAERRALLEAVQAAHGNMSRVATSLGISRNTLYRKLKRHQIDPSALR